MFEQFIGSWDLFASSHVAAWVIAALLGLVGVVVVARDQIFIGAAVSQASALGVAVAITIVGASAEVDADHPPLLPGVLAVLFAVGAALMTGVRRGGGGESEEGLTGWVFLVSAAMSALVLSGSAHGPEEVRKLLVSDTIGATWYDVWILAPLLIASAGAVVIGGRSLLLVVMDPETAAALGLRAAWWRVGLAAWLGLTIGLSLRSAGMLYTFGCLVLPAMAAKRMVRQVRPMFLVAPITAVVVAMVASVAAHHHDFPAGQATVALLGLLLPVTWAWGWISRW